MKKITMKTPIQFCWCFFVTHLFYLLSHICIDDFNAYKKSKKKVFSKKNKGEEFL